MKVTYYVIKRQQVGDGWREPGDLIPEAATWPFLASYVRDGHIAPVLVATLPEENQLALLDWDADQNKVEAAPVAADVKPARTKEKV